MQRYFNKKSNTLSQFKLSFVVCLIATSLVACSSTSRRDVTGSINTNAPASQSDIQSWAARYQKKPNDANTIITYALILKRAGHHEQSVAVLSRGVLVHTDDHHMKSEYGKALAASGKFEQALRVMQDTFREDAPDWRLMSATGAVYDQLGKHDEARAIYQRALKLRPDEAAILNNLGMSYALTNELHRSEAILAGIVQSGRADTKTRQNLALVLGLQGRYQEAEHVMRFEMSPQEAQQNVNFLRQLVESGATLKDIQNRSEQQAG